MILKNWGEETEATDSRSSKEQYVYELIMKSFQEEFVLSAVENSTVYAKPGEKSWLEWTLYLGGGLWEHLQDIQEKWIYQKKKGSALADK